jgi:hypothetical protein
MSTNRLKDQRALFILGMIALVMSFIFLVLCLYLLPHLLFSWRYAAPTFVFHMREWLQSTFGFGDSGASRIIFFSFLSMLFFFVAMAYYSSHRIDSEIFRDESEEIDEPVKEKKERGEARGLVFKISLFIIIVFLVAELFEWFIHNPLYDKRDRTKLYSKSYSRMHTTSVTGT